MSEQEPKVTGIGGIFFKCKDKEKVKDWYSANLGMDTDEYGSLFQFREKDNPNKIGHLQWSTFAADTDYFLPSQKEFMINYRVNNLELLLNKLKANGVQVLDEIEEYSYGKFVHILDLEGNKIELWEPIDEVFSEIK